MKKANRFGIYLLGLLILAAGITLNTKTGLGVSPIISVAFSVSEIFQLNFGDTTFLLYVIFVIAQLFLCKKGERLAVLLQLAVSLIFSRALNWFSALMTYDHNAHSLPMNLGVLALAVALTGVGVSLSINMRLIPNPGDGIVQTLAQKFGWSQGFSKNAVDFFCVAVALAIGFCLAGRIIGIGLGTLLAMVGVGRVVAVTNVLLQKKMLAAAGLDI